MRSRRLSWRLRFTAPAAVALAAAGTASAADPQKYHVVLAPTGQAGLDGALRDSATLLALRDKAPVGPFALVARARGDVGRLTEALHSYGYYLGTLGVTIDGLALDDPALPAKLDGEPAGSDVAVAITPTLGAQFRLGHVTLNGDVPPGTESRLAVHPGDPALAAPVLAAGSTLQDDLQNDGRALAKVAPPVAVLMVGSHTLDVSYQVSAGPRVNLGPISISGEQRLNESYIRRRLLLHQGQPFDPRQIEKARQDLAAVPALASVRITQPDSLDALGEMPLFVQVAERPHHAVDLGVAFSTDEGGSLTASWTHRNLFGNAEQLVLSAAATQLGGSASKQPGYDIGALLSFPDWLARRQVLALNVQALREYLTAYNRTAALASAIVSRKLTDELTVSAGVAFEEARIEQEGDRRTYTLPQLPLTIAWDNTGSLFEPIHGFRASLMVTPTYSLPNKSNSTGNGFLPPGSGRSSSFVIVQLSGSTYLDVGKWLIGEAPGRSILALRGLIGSISGAGTFDVPPDQRFYAGGGGTIRGWRYQSVGPAFPDRNPVGGTSVEVGSVEFRQRFLSSYGVVVFVDAGEVTARDSPFTGGGTVRIGAGLGFRYFTSLGPIRADIAVPLNKDPNIKTDAVEAYLGLGEAF